MTAPEARRRRFGRLENLRRLPGGRRLLTLGKSSEVAAELPDRHVGRVVTAIEEALSRREPVARREAASEVVRRYAGLDEQGCLRFFEILANQFGADHAAISSAAADLAAGTSNTQRARAEHRLREAIKPRYAELLHIITGLPGGVKLLVDLRADLLMYSRGNATLELVDDELVGHLSALFDVGLLELRRITWEASSAALLERLITYEAVHEITGWDDLKHRLDGDRRCFAFLHPAMPDEPLVFVEIALTKGLAANLPALLDREAPSTDPEDADTAIFYSITNCQPGLAGVNLGNELVKHVVHSLQQDLPRLKHFATLSPINSFRAWIEQALTTGDLTPGERQEFDASTDDILRELGEPGWPRDQPSDARFRSGVLSMASRYLTTPANGRVQDPVGNFHLSNGARVERLNWLANPAPYELTRSFGLMVNYRYVPADIERNVERYLDAGVVAASSQVQGLIR